MCELVRYQSIAGAFQRHAGAREPSAARNCRALALESGNDAHQMFTKERKMSPSNASAISAFLAGGGQIVRVQEPVRATTQDVLDYLQSCGIAAKYSSNPNVYWYKRKRVSLSQVVVVANRQRRTRQLPPFAVEP